MRTRLRGFGTGRVGVGVLLMVTMVATLLAPIGVRTAAAQDDLAIQTRAQILHAAPSLGQVEVHINYDEVLDEFTYGQSSDWIDFQPGGARVTITADRAGFNYAVFDAVYPAPAGNDYYLVITDALTMGALRRLPGYSPGELAVRAVEAGTDVVLSPPDIAQAHAGIVAAVQSGR